MSEYMIEDGVAVSDEVAGYNPEYTVGLKQHAEWVQKLVDIVGDDIDSAWITLAVRFKNLYDNESSIHRSVGYTPTTDEYAEYMRLKEKFEVK